MTASPCGLWCIAPAGPSTPFGTPTLVLYDTIRTVSLVSAAVAAAIAVYLILHQRADRAPGQMVRFASSVALLAVAASVSIEHLGDYANWRTVLILLATTSAAAGNWVALRWETPRRSG